jgi:gibberellin 2-oxidase
MVVSSAAPACRDMAPSLGIPTVDMSAPAGRAELSRQMVEAFAERGFFKAVNHGVPPQVAARLDAASAVFFAQPAPEKQAAGPPDPLGYGSRSIGSHGDVGELEYLILHTDPEAVARKAKAIDREDPSRFRYGPYGHACMSLSHMNLNKPFIFCSHGDIFFVC